MSVKKEKKVKTEISVHKRPIICPPDMAGRSPAFRTVGFICRMIVIFAAVFGLTMFVCDAFNMGETAVKLQKTSTFYVMENQAVTSQIALGCAVIVVGLSLLFSGKIKTVAGIGVLGISAAIEFIRKAPYIDFVINSAKMFVCDILTRLSRSDYQKSIVDSLYNKIHPTLEIGSFTESELRTGGVLVFAFILALIFVPCLIKKVRVIAPTIVSALILVLIFTMNISRGTLGISLVIVSFAAVLVMAGYDGIFIPGKKASKYDTGITMFENENTPESDKEQLKKKQSVKSAKSGMGGIAGAITLAIATAIVIIPMLTVTNSLKIPWFSEKFDYVREYITALLQGDESTLDRLDYENSHNINEAHTTEAADRIFNNTQIMYVETRTSSTPIYLRGWVATDYENGAWYLANADSDGQSAVSKYQSKFGLESAPDEQSKINFFKLMYPDEITDILETEDFSEKTRTKNDLGFAAFMVGMRRINLRDSAAYLPSYYNVNKGILEYGSMNDAGATYINYFDGIYTGRYFSRKVAEGDKVKYSTVTFDPIMKNNNWTDKVSAGIAEYNLSLLAANINKYGGKNLSAFIVADNSSKLMTVDYYVNYNAKTKIGDVSWSSAHESGTALKSNYAYALNFEINDVSKSEDEQKYSVVISTLYGDLIIECTNAQKTGDGAYLADGSVSSVRYELSGILSATISKESALYSALKDDSEFIAAMNNERAYKEFVYETYTKTAGSDIITEKSKQAAAFAGVDTKVAASEMSTDAATYSERDKLVRGVIDYIIDAENGLGCEYRGVFIQTDDGEISDADREKYLLRNQSKADPNLDPIENFLVNTKEGYCVQFASAAALILREYGIPVRYCEGYIVSRFSTIRGGDSFGTSGSYVHDYESHAWIEVYYDGIGWVQYETTPEYYTTAYGAKTEEGGTSSSTVTPDRPSIDDIITDIESETDPYERADEIETESDDEEYTHEDGTPMSKEEIAAEKLKEQQEAETRELMLKSFIGLAIIAGIVAIFVVIKIFADKAKDAESERRRNAETILSEHFGELSGENDLRESAALVICSLTDILKILGLEPDVGEFRDEYAKRLSLDLEDILGHASEYDGENPSEEVPDETPDGGKKKKKKPVKISDICISEALDNIATEEFGNGMTVEQMKPVAAFYLELRDGLSKRVGLLRRIFLRFFKHRI